MEKKSKCWCGRISVRSPEKKTPLPAQTQLGFRLTLAKEENMPAYIVFSNATLQDMAKKAPVTMADFLNVSGVGNYKAQRYGQTFITAIKKYLGEE